MLLADDLGFKDTGVGLQRINGRVDTLLNYLTGKNRSSVKMCECYRRSRIRKVVRRDVNSLYLGY